jgi:aspartate/methionine/tyrosine aminotransferase
MIFKNLTEYEIDTLARAYNLTDGHAFRGWSPAEEAIIDSAPQLFKRHNRLMQAQIERDYVRDFLALGRQTCDEERVRFLMCFTASMSFEIIANFLRLRKASVTLIEPCFDNLADIFRRHELRMEPWPDRLLEADEATFEAALRGLDTDAICLVSPNNPTGLTLGERNLRRLARFCQEHGKLLILDTTFRWYTPRSSVYDQYRILLDSDADFIVVEDTGKTWPSAEIKAPFFALSASLYADIYDIYTDFLLHVSPVGIRLMHEFIRLSMSDDLAHVQGTVARNREVLHQHLAGTFLTPCERPFMSVSWLRINAPLNGLQLKHRLDEHGVFVLPGEHFYWSDHRLGDGYIRLALTRDADMFRQAATLLGQLCRPEQPARSLDGVEVSA